MLRSTTQTCHSTRGPSVAREAAALRDTRLPQNPPTGSPGSGTSSNWFIAELTHGLLGLQAASTGCPRDADLHKSNENAITVRRQGKPSEDASGGAGPDIYENREPAPCAATADGVAGEDARRRRTAQLPDGRKRLGRDAAHSQTRHAYVFRLRRL